MLLPQRLRDDSTDFPSERARLVWGVFYDLFEALVAEHPPVVWKRRLIEHAGSLWAHDSVEGLAPAARLVSLNAPWIKSNPNAHADDDEDEGLSLPEPTPATVDTLADVLDILVEEGISGPAGYRRLLEWVAKNELTVDGGWKAKDAWVEALRKLRETHHEWLECLLGLDSQCELIAAGDATSQDVLHLLFTGGLDRLGASIDELEIPGESAQFGYARRDKDVDHVLQWDGRGLPPEVDPGIQLAISDPLRAERLDIHRSAMSKLGDDWGVCTEIERVRARVAIKSEREPESANATVNGWLRRNQFDLLQRWLVGWNFSIELASVCSDTG